jgi:hypothetical protein
MLDNREDGTGMNPWETALIGATVALFAFIYCVLALIVVPGRQRSDCRVSGTVWRGTWILLGLGLLLAVASVVLSWMGCIRYVNSHKAYYCYSFLMVAQCTLESTGSDLIRKNRVASLGVCDAGFGHGKGTASPIRGRDLPRGGALERGGRDGSALGTAF